MAPRAVFCATMVHKYHLQNMLNTAHKWYPSYSLAVIQLMYIFNEFFHDSVFQHRCHLCAVRTLITNYVQIIQFM